MKSIEDNAASLTRRSAGIPAIATGILAAYPGDKFFDDVLVKLQAMANAPIGANLGSLPQVHALNCLKDIFTDARFGLSTETYVADALEVAASCLESQMYDCLYFLHKHMIMSDTFQMEHTQLRPYAVQGSAEASQRWDGYFVHESVQLTSPILATNLQKVSQPARPSTKTT